MSGTTWGFIYLAKLFTDFLLIKYKNLENMWSQIVTTSKLEYNTIEEKVKLVITVD